jgi:division protein 1
MFIQTKEEQAKKIKELQQQVWREDRRGERGERREERGERREERGERREERGEKDGRREAQEWQW